MKNKHYEVEMDWNTIGAIALIVTGILFLFGQVFGLSIGAATAVFFIFFFLPGLPFLYFAVTGGKDLSWLAIPGSLLSGTGVIFILQSLTGHWESWAYAWTLYGVLIGAPLLFAGRRNQEASVEFVGKMMSVFSSVGFVALAVFFELIIFNGSLGKLVIALSFIALGGWLILREQDFDLQTGLGSADKRKRKNTLDEYVQSSPIEKAESYVEAAKSRLRASIQHSEDELPSNGSAPSIEPTPNGTSPVQE